MARASRATTMVGAALAVATISGAAHACWDGYVTTVGRVTITSALGEGSEWSLERAQSIAIWSRRIEGVLPLSTSLEVELGGTTALCAPEGDKRVCRDGPHWRTTEPEDLFRLVAKETHASRAQRRRAKTRGAEVFTVQLFASRTREAADALARRIDEAQPDVRGFYDEGGHPATNPSAHVLEAQGARGEKLFRVVVGAYLSHDEADAARARVEQSTGVRGFSRRA